MVNKVTFPTSGNTYSDGSSDEGTGVKFLDNDGHRENLINLFSDFITEAEAKVAATGASLAATSTSSMAIANTGSKSFVMESGKGFSVNSHIRVAHDASNWMEGVITAFDQETGATSFTADNSAGTGTFTSWTIVIAGTRGVTGATGAAGADGVATVGEILSYILALS